MSAENEEGMRSSIIFEINSSDAITMYEKYLTEIVTPKIPKDGKVIIHGHSDNIGDEAHNMDLSLAWANEVSIIMNAALRKAGRSDVKFEVYGFGEDKTWLHLIITTPKNVFITGLSLLILYLRQNSNFINIIIS